MCNQAITWAKKQKLGRSTTKFVLFLLADMANSKTLECFPSLERLVEYSGLNIKTVQQAIVQLRECGLILDTGKKKGRTNQIPVYRINMPGLGVVEVSQKRVDSIRETSPIRAITEAMEDIPF